MKVVLNLDSYDLKIYNGNKLQTHRKEESPSAMEERSVSDEDEVVLSDSGRPSQVRSPASSPVSNWRLHYNEKEVRNYKEFRADKQIVSRS